MATLPQEFQSNFGPVAKGPARLKDAIEEMGALENFLP
jgi:hypothetical protein